MRAAYSLCAVGAGAARERCGKRRGRREGRRLRRRCDLVGGDGRLDEGGRVVGRAGHHAHRGCAQRLRQRHARPDGERGGRGHREEQRASDGHEIASTSCAEESVARGHFQRTTYSCVSRGNLLVFRRLVPLHAPREVWQRVLAVVGARHPRPPARHRDAERRSAGQGGVSGQRTRSRSSLNVSRAAKI